MDGYWLVADLFGIWNPRKQSLGVLKHFGRRLWNLGRSSPFDSIERNTSSQWILFAYTGLCVVFVVYISQVTAYQVIFYVAPHYPEAWILLFHEVRRASLANVWVIGRDITEVAWRTVILYGCSLIAWHACVAVTKHALGMVREARSRIHGLG
jgi:hypothetical protein